MCGLCFQGKYFKIIFLPGDFGFNPAIGTIPEVNLDDIMFEHNMIQLEVEPSELLQEHEKNGNEDKRDKINENGGQNQIGKCFAISSNVFGILAAIYAVSRVCINC